MRTLYDATKALALREGKIPVLALIDKGRHGEVYHKLMSLSTLEF